VIQHHAHGLTPAGIGIIEPHTPLNIFKPATTSNIGEITLSANKSHTPTMPANHDCTQPKPTINPNSITTDDCTLTAHKLVTSTVPNPVLVDPIPIKPVPADPVHVDPVSVTSAYSNLITVTISFAFITLSGIKHIRQTVKNHLYSISLTHVGVFAVFWS
jgi:hypothetical protein